MPDQHDGKLSCALGDQFDQALQRDQGLGVQVVGVVNEQRHGLLGPPEQILEIAFAQLGIVRDRHILFGREIVKQGGYEHGHHDPGLVQGQRARHDHLVFPLEFGPQAARQNSLAGTDDRGQRDQAAARDRGLNVARDLRVVLGLENPASTGGRAKP